MGNKKATIQVELPAEMVERLIGLYKSVEQLEARGKGTESLAFWGFHGEIEAITGEIIEAVIEQAPKK